MSSYLIRNKKLLFTAVLFLLFSSNKIIAQASATILIRSDSVANPGRIVRIKDLKEQGYIPETIATNVTRCYFAQKTGKYIYCNSSDEWYSADVFNTNENHRLIPNMNGYLADKNLRRISLSNDGSKIAVGTSSYDGRKPRIEGLKVYSLFDDHKRCLFSLSKQAYIAGITWSPDDSLLYYHLGSVDTPREGGLQLVSVDPFNFSTIETIHSPPSLWLSSEKMDRPPEWSPDYEKIVFLGTQQETVNIAKRRGVANNPYSVLNCSSGEIFPLKGTQFIWSKDSRSIYAHYISSSAIDAEGSIQRTYTLVKKNVETGEENIEGSVPSSVSGSFVGFVSDSAFRWLCMKQIAPKKFQYLIFDLQTRTTENIYLWDASILGWPRVHIIPYTENQ